MGFRIEIVRSAVRELEALDRAQQVRIVRYLRERVAAAEHPGRFGRPLRGEMAGLWRYRVGDYRIVCRIDPEDRRVPVLRIAHRRNAYD